ncbi:MAG: DUF58 domain-containing protein [Planctomycetaceae bacterium]|nr:DUF58 domain-containing protein [Planctomycetaceae bacterium]
MFPWTRPAAATPSPVSRRETGDLVDPRVMNEIGHLELLSRTVVDGLLAGKHRSTTKGGCCEFAQHRQYSFGDELRQIDWQVYARSDRYYIKQFEEETNLHTLLAIDASGSMAFGLSTVSKFDYARRAAACLARLLLHQRDAVGAVMLAEQRSMYVPPRQKASHLRALLATMQSAQPSGGGRLGAQIRECAPRLQRRGMFILFTDGFGDLEDLGRALRIVRGRGHDVIVMNILAPEELHFQFRHWSAFESLELAGQRVKLDPASIRDEYLRRLQAHLDQLAELTVGLGGDYVRMTTQQDLAEVLGWFLRSRSAKGA